METAKRVVRNIWENPAASELISNSDQEITVIAEICGVMTKTRMDGLCIPKRTGWDIKTSDDISPQRFYRHGKKLGYYFQFAFHDLALSNAGPDAIQLEKYEIIAAEIDNDFDTGVLMIPPQLIDDWKSKVEDVLDRYRVARSRNEWIGLYPAGIGVLEVPDYDMAENGVFQG